MLFGKKENKGELPDLPPLPALPSTQKPVMVQSMPVFPDSAQSDNVLRNPPQNDYDRMPEKAKVVEMEEWRPQNYGSMSRGTPVMQEEDEEEPMPMMRRSRELEPMQKPHGSYAQNNNMSPVMPQQPPADVFVRIDKFHSARKSLSEIHHRLQDIDELVRRIRETKVKEEQELASWERDLMQIKSRVQTVAENIFEKVE